MKKTVNYLIIFLSSIILFSCSYDDEKIWSEIDKLKTDIKGLKEQTTSLQTVVNALNAGKVITNVKELENKKGFEITFNDGKSIQVMNGEKVPIIGIKQEKDGKYYWTITTNNKTEFLLDKNKKKLPVTGVDGKTPIVGIDAEGYWTVDNTRIKDANNKPIKAQGNSFFKEIKNGKDAVTFVLADGESIVIHKTDTFLYFDNPENNQFFPLQPGDNERLRIKFSNIDKMEITYKPEGWRVNLHRPDKYVMVSVPENAKFGVYEVTLRGIDKNGMVFMAIAKISIGGSEGFLDPKGVFILNEGNMTTEDGSLIFISSTGTVFDKVYATINGHELGNVTQDLFIKDGKMWIISQNGKVAATGTAFNNEGMLVVADVKTMKRVAVYDNEFKDAKGKYKLSWPTHIAVLNNENVFIRDNNGVNVFNSTRKELSLIPETKGAAKKPMVVADKKVFVINDSFQKIMVFKADNKTIIKTIEMGAPISGIVKSKDGNLWVSTTGEPNKISKIDSKTYAIIKSNNITEGGLSSGWASTPGITAKGDTLYYSNASTKIYRHIFSKNETKEMVDAKTYNSNANIVYNNIAVHPETGDVYINTLKGFGWDFTINNIMAFNFDKDDKPILKADYQDHTRFPAGIFFIANFK